jgi:hypothetical protein
LGKVLWVRVIHCDWQGTQILFRLPVRV